MKASKRASGRRGAAAGLPRRESDLYDPLRALLERQGYAVQAEVDGCDLVARRGEDVIVVEMKRRRGLDLLVQATDRQRITDSVYVALPGPAPSGRDRAWVGFQRLLRRLELGLILVTLKPRARVDILFHPLPARRAKLKRRRRAVLREIEGRSGHYNRGGTGGRAIVTAYRESAIRVAVALDLHGPLAPRTLRRLGCGEKTQSILANNHYGWFERIDRGIYTLTGCGKDALEGYGDIAAHYAEEIRRLQVEGADAAP